MSYNGFYNYIRITFLLLINIAFGQVGKDSLVVTKNDTITRIEVLNVKSDTISSEPSPKKERLQDVIDYDSDEQYQDVKKKFTYLVRNAKVLYTDLEISADYIEINWDTGDIYAVGKQDSLGNILEPSIFKQGQKEIEYGSFKYNINTKQGTAYNVRTEEAVGGESGVIVAGVVKQYNDSISGMRRVAYTTDEYFIQKKDSLADYYLQTEVAKYAQGKEPKVITGPIVMKIYDVPTIFALPFSFLPMGQSRSAGILLPSFGERESQGFYLNGLGFYYPIGEYMDVAVTADIYTRGSLGLQAISNYKKRYKFSGGFNFDWERRIQGIKGLTQGQDAYSKSTLYRLRWSHRQDSKANPNLIFSANVNYSSSQYYRNGINNNNLFNGNVLTNTTSSSISINKTFRNTPFSASLNLSHNQNNSSSTGPNPVTFDLPTLAVNMNRIYPFAPKAGGKKGLLQNIGFNYNFNLRNTVNTTDQDVFTDKMWDNVKNGAKHQLNFNTGTTLFNYFPLNFSAGYNEVWYLKTVEKRYNPEDDLVEDIDKNGFSAFRTFTTSANLQTTLYGIAQFGNEDDDKRIKAIRHMVTPSISLGYTPDFASENWGYYDTYRDATGRKQLYSKYDGGIFGSPGQGLQTNLSFGISNNIEMKVRSRTDSTGVQKIKIFDYLNIAGSYNLAADSLQLSPIGINGATSILKNKMRVNFGAGIDPYKTVFTDENINGIRINEFGDFGINRYNVSMSYSLNNSTFGEKKEMKYSRRGNIRYEEYYFDDDSYAKFSIPWNLDVSLNHNYNRTNAKTSTTNTSVRLSGTVAPSPYWRISGSTNFDLQSMELSYTRFSFSRDLRSFIIDFSWVPFGQYRTWNFFVGIKANFLRDALKYEERNFRSSGSTF